MNQSAYEAARKLAVAYALNGPGAIGQAAGASFRRDMGFLVSVFRNSLPMARRADVVKQLLDDKQIPETITDAATGESRANPVFEKAVREMQEASKPKIAVVVPARSYIPATVVNEDGENVQNPVFAARLDESLKGALEALSASAELEAIAPTLPRGELSVIEEAAAAMRASGFEGGAWVREASARIGEADAARRDALADAAKLASAFVGAVEGDTIDSAVAGNPAPLRDALSDLKAALLVATPFDGAPAPTLEVAADAAHAAYNRYAHDGRAMVMASGDFDLGVNAPSHAKRLGDALDGLGYQVPRSLWIDKAVAAKEGTKPEYPTVVRADADAAVTQALVVLQRVHDRLDIVDRAALGAHDQLGEALKEAGYLLPGDSSKRTESVATQSPRGTDDQILAILGAAAVFETAARNFDTAFRSSETGLGGAKFTPEMILGNDVAKLGADLRKAGIANAADVIDAEIVSGRRPFDFSFISRDKIPGVNPSMAESEAYRLAAAFAKENPDEYAAQVQWAEPVQAENDIEAVSRFHDQLDRRRTDRAGIVVLASEGIDRSRLQDIEAGRAEGILGINVDSRAMTAGEAELVLKMVESVGRIVDRAYAHTDNHENAAFPVGIARDAILSAKQIEEQTSLRSTLSAIAAGKRDAAGISREGAEALYKFVNVTTDAMKTVVAQDEYIREEDDQGVQGRQGVRVRGTEDEEPGNDGSVSLSGAGHVLEGDEGEEGSDEMDFEDPEAEDDGFGASAGGTGDGVLGQNMWAGWQDLDNAAKHGSGDIASTELFQRNFIAVLNGQQMAKLTRAYETTVAKGIPVALASMAGREGAPSLASLTVGVDVSAYASIQEAMGIGMGGDAKLKAERQQDVILDRMMRAKPEMSYDQYRKLPERERTATASKTFFMDMKVNGQFFPMQRPKELLPVELGADGKPLSKKDLDQALAGRKLEDVNPARRAWFLGANSNGSSRADIQADKRRIKSAVQANKVGPDGESNRDFLTFLTRLQDKNIVAPTLHAAEALREASREYLISTENAKVEAQRKLDEARLAKLGDWKTNVVMDRSDAAELIKVWEAAGAKTGGFPVMVKTEAGVSIEHKDLPTKHGRVSNPKAVEGLRDRHYLAVVDMNALKQGVSMLGQGRWDKLEIEMIAGKIQAYGPHKLVEPKKTLEAADKPVRQTQYVI